MAKCRLDLKLYSTRLSDFAPSVGGFDVSPEVNRGREMFRLVPESVFNLDWFNPEVLDSCGRVFDADLCNRGVDIAVVYYYHKLVNPPEAYLRHLDYLTVLSGREFPARGQFVGFKAWEHKGENGSTIILPEINTEKYNPASKFQSIRSSASRTAKALTNLNWLPSSNENKKCLVTLDLTFPREISGLLLGGNPRKLEAQYWDTYKRFLGFLNAELGTASNPHGVDGLGNNANLHLWSSASPTEPHAHFHSNLIWAKPVRNVVKPLDWFARGKPVDADLVKSLWAKAVNSVFGVRYWANYSQNADWVAEMLGASLIDVFVGWIPLSPKSYWARSKANPDSYVKSRVIHRLKYARRKPLTDLAEYYTTHEFDSDLSVSFNLYLLDYRNSSRCFGLWSSLSNSVNVEESEVGDVQLCPLCGSKVEAVYRVSAKEFKPDLLAFVGKHKGLWTGKPPDGLRLISNTKRENSATRVGSVELLGGSTTEVLSRLVV